MRTHVSRTTALAAAGVLTLSLAACGGSDESAQAFCDSFTSVEDMSADLQSVDLSDPDAAAASLEELTTEIESIEAPEEIADSYTVVSSAFRSFSDTVADALDDPANADPSVLTEATNSFTSEDFSNATAELDEYSAANCS